VGVLKEIDDEPRLRGISVAIMSAHPSIRRVSRTGVAKTG
jgi:hypothetical protein